MVIQTSFVEILFLKYSGYGMNLTNMMSSKKSQSLEPYITRSLGLAKESHVMDIEYIETSTRFL